jgi:hypothetical protein
MLGLGLKRRRKASCICQEVRKTCGKRQLPEATN